MLRTLVGVLILATACVPQEAVEPPGPYALAIEVRPAGELRAWDATGARRVFATPGSATVSVLTYDAPLRDVGIDVRDDGTVGLEPLDPGGETSWSIPVPAGWTQAEARCGEACATTGEATLPPGLERVGVVRAPCPAMVVEPVTWSDANSIASLWPVGDAGAILLGQSPRLEGDPLVFHTIALLRAEPGQARAVAVLPSQIQSPAFVFAPDPYLYSERGQLRLVWQAEPTYPGTSTFALTVTATAVRLSDRRALTSTSSVLINPTAITSTTVGDVTTTVAMNTIYTSETDHRMSLQVVDPVSGALVTVARGVAHDDDACRAGTTTSLLALTGARRGVVSFRREPIREFDLDSTRVLGAIYGPGEADDVCRSARAVLASGDELLTWANSTPQVTDFAPRAATHWRRTAADPWIALHHPPGEDPIGSAIAARDDLVYVAGSSGVLVYQRDPRRPELRPRFCGNYPVAVAIRLMRATRYGVMVAGTSGEAAWIRPADER